MTDGRWRNLTDGRWRNLISPSPRCLVNGATVSVDFLKGPVVLANPDEGFVGLTWNIALVMPVLF
jgi:hypothetical protein